MTTAVKSTPIDEAYRYLQNAKQILKEKAGIDGNYYKDSKYVKMASDIAYKAMLVALDPLLDYEETKKQNAESKKKKGKKQKQDTQKGRRHVKNYKEFIGKKNKKILEAFNNAYLILHLYGGYDGGNEIQVIKKGLSLAKTVIDWAKQRLKNIDKRDKRP